MMISVIIPTLNEEKYVRRCLESVRDQDFTDYEIIVADGGSSDRTVKIARSFADRVVLCRSRGIGEQQNEAARAARGSVMLFTQADAIIPKGALKKLSEYLTENKGVAYGTFLIQFEGDGLRNVIVNKLTASTMSMPLHIISGVALFVRKEHFFAVKGFRNIICEDLDLGFRLRKHGRTGIIKNPRFLASSRRLEREGYARTIYLWIKQYLIIRLGRTVHIREYGIVR